MALSERFEDLPAWQAAADLYGFAEGLLREGELGASPGWRDQFDRAALAISSHLARSTERGLLTGERLAAVNQARCAVAEVRSMLRVLERRKVSRECRCPSRGSRRWRIPARRNCGLTRTPWASRPL